MADLLELLAETNRRKIMRLVWNEERSAGDIAAQFDITFGAVSQHLHILRDAGLLDVRREGRSRIYRANKQSLGPLAKALEAMWSDALDRLKHAAEAEVRLLRETVPRPRGSGVRNKTRRS